MTDHNTTDLQRSIKEQHRQGSLHPADPDMLLSGKGYSQNRIDPAGQSSLSGEQTGAGVQSSGKEERKKSGGIQSIVPFAITFVLGILVTILIFRMVYSPSSDANEGTAASAGTVAPDAIVEIPDPVLKKAIQDALDIEGREITEKDALSLTEFELDFDYYKWECLEYGDSWEEIDKVKDITGLSAFKNLTDLNLSDSPVSNISELSGLTNLTVLRLNGNQLSDISALSGLTNLTYLELKGSQVSDISALLGMRDLTYLHLGGNELSDISALSGLTNLTDLYLNDNQISDISALSGPTNLMYLNLQNNQLSDISALSGLTKLEYLDLSSNPVVDNKSREEIKKVLSRAKKLKIYY